MKTVLDDAFAYAVLSIVEEIPVGTVATYGQIARLMGTGEKRPPGGSGPVPRPAVRTVPLSPGGQPRRTAGAWVAGTSGTAGGGGRGVQGCVPRGFEAVSVAVLSRMI